MSSLYTSYVYGERASKRCAVSACLLSLGPYSYKMEPGVPGGRVDEWEGWRTACKGTEQQPSPWVECGLGTPLVLCCKKKVACSILHKLNNFLGTLHVETKPQIRGRLPSMTNLLCLERGGQYSNYFTWQVRKCTQRDSTALNVCRKTLISGHCWWHQSGVFRDALFDCLERWKSKKKKKPDQAISDTYSTFINVE